MKLLVITQKVDKNAPILGFFHRWIEEFAKHTKKVFVICLEEGVHDLPENVTVLSLGKEERQSRWQYIKRFFGYIFQYRREYDAVFVHMNPIYVILGAPLWKIWSKKVSLWYTHKSVNIKLRLAEKLTDIIFSASERSFRLSSEKVRYIGHGIDTDFFVPKENEDDDTLHVLSVGRISPVKDYETLLQAVRKIQQKTDFSFRLTIVGGPVTDEDSEYFADILQEVEEWGLEDEVIFAGSVSQEEVVSFYQDADVFVNMSKTGSVDKAVLEAMATETIPLTSNDAFRDVFENPERHMFEQGNSDDLAKKIIDISNLQQTYDRPRLRQIVEETYSVSALIPKILSYLKES